MGVGEAVGTGVAVVVGVTVGLTVGVRFPVGVDGTVRASLGVASSNGISPDEFLESELISGPADREMYTVTDLSSVTRT